MKNFTLFTSLLALSIATAQANIVIPDLFGSYQKGAEAARQANTYGYYGYSGTPRLSYDVIKQNGSSKWTKRVSLKNNDRLCWTIKNLDPQTVYFAREAFGNMNGARIVADAILPFRYVEETDDYTIIASSINQNRYNIANCWRFSAGMPTGKYTHQIIIGDFQFPEESFVITD